MYAIRSYYGPSAEVYFFFLHHILVLFWDVSLDGVVSTARLLAQLKVLDDGAVAGDVDFLQIREKATALTDHLQQTTTAVMIFLVRVEMGREPIDA